MNTRPLISRNKREGKYLGFYKWEYDIQPKHICQRHHRRGNYPESWIPINVGILY